MAVLRDGRLEAVLFVGAEPEAALARMAQVAVRVVRIIPAGERRALLAGRPVEGAADEGPIVCVCFQVGAARIEAAAAAGDRTTVEEIGRALGAGTNCGCCIPEIRRLIAIKGGGP